MLQYYGCARMCIYHSHSDYTHSYTHTYIHTFSLMNIINILIFCDKHPYEDRYIILLKHTFCVETNYQFEGMFTIYMTTLYDKGFVTLQIWNFLAIIQISFQDNISIWFITKLYTLMMFVFMYMITVRQFDISDWYKFSSPNDAK